MRVVYSALSVGAEGVVFLLHACVMVSVEFEAVRPCSGMLRVMLYSMRCLLHTGTGRRCANYDRFVCQAHYSTVPQWDASDALQYRSATVVKKNFTTVVIAGRCGRSTSFTFHDTGANRGCQRERAIQPVRHRHLVLTFTTGAER